MGGWRVGAHQHTSFTSRAGREHGGALPSGRVVLLVLRPACKRGGCSVQGERREWGEPANPGPLLRQIPALPPTSASTHPPRQPLPPAQRRRAGVVPAGAGAQPHFAGCPGGRGAPLGCGRAVRIFGCGSGAAWGGSGAPPRLGQAVRRTGKGLFELPEAEGRGPAWSPGDPGEVEPGAGARAAAPGGAQAGAGGSDLSARSAPAQALW